MDKVIVLNKYVWIFLTTTVFWVLAVNDAQSQTLDHKNEILVYILPDSLELPPGLRENIGLERALKKSQGLSRAFQNMPIKSIGKAFPNLSDSDTMLVREDGRHIKLPQWSRVFKIVLNDSHEMDDILERLNREPSVLFAERAYSDRTFESNYSYSDQWHLNNTGQIGGSADISAPQGWQIFTGSPTVKLAIFDDGIDKNHDSFSTKLHSDYDMVLGYHGTRVAGVAAARHDAGNVRGVDDKVQIISKNIKNLDFDGVVRFKTNNQIASEIIDAINEGADVLNFSNSSSEPSSLIRGALATAYKMDRVTVAAMGNQGSSTPRYPAAQPWVIAVGATTQHDVKWQDSNTGSHINVTAPGVGIVTTDLNNSYAVDEGTSYAAPIVSGIATLLKGYNSSLHNDDIRRIIELSADKVGIEPYNANGWNNHMGYGRVNAYHALKRLQSPYVLQHHTAIGGSVHSVSNTYKITFFGVDGLSDGVYYVKRHEVRKNISLNNLTDRELWIRGAYVTGFSDTNPNYGEHFAEILSINNNTATLRTYVYEVLYTYTGQPPNRSWVPTVPSNVEFAYTVHGIQEAAPPSPPNAPSVSINTSGFNPVLNWNTVSEADNYNIYRGTVQGAPGTVTCSHVQNYMQIQSTTSTSYTDFSITIDPNEPILVCYYVTSVNQNGESNPSNKVGTHGMAPFSILPGEHIEKEGVPSTFDLKPNYPNPFNPVTQITYDIPEQSMVILQVYDIMGRLISTLEANTKPPGRHNIAFDASHLTSGMYIIRINAASVSGSTFTHSRKMHLIK